MHRTGERKIRLIRDSPDVILRNHPTFVIRAPPQTEGHKLFRNMLSSFISIPAARNKSKTVENSTTRRLNRRAGKTKWEKTSHRRKEGTAG